MIDRPQRYRLAKALGIPEQHIHDVLADAWCQQTLDTIAKTLEPYAKQMEAMYQGKRR